MISSITRGDLVRLTKRSAFVRHSQGNIRSASGTTEGPTYFERKQARKDERTHLYQAKMQRVIALKDRRSHAPKDVLKQEFQEWWQAKLAREQKWDRQARHEGKDWKMEVAVVLERMPQILPDRQDSEKKFDELQAYLKQFGKEYPKEFSAALPKDGSAPVSDEDLLALLPEGFRPAPRETEADTSGRTDTLDRKLKGIVYFMVDKQLPTTSLQNADSETLLEAAKRAISENGGSQLEFYCPSNSPVAVHMTKAEEGSSFFGTKTFFVRLQYDDGTIQVKDLEKKQIAWLDRSEIVGLFEGSSNGADAKFYQYLL